MQNANDNICWQCGAPSDPRCAHKRRLEASPIRKTDGECPAEEAKLGYTLHENRTGVVSVEVSVPRCEACANRNLLHVLFRCLGGGLGAVAGLTVYPGFGGAMVGLGLGAGLTHIFLAFSRQTSGLRALHEYPALLQLRRNGWHEPY